MLSQLARLSVEADGRYATASELQFLKDYLATADQRMSAYEKIRDNEVQIMIDMETQSRLADANVFQKGERDVTQVCRRDRKQLLQCSAAAMLIDDLDRLRDGLLLWQSTIVRALKDEQASQVVCRVLPHVMQAHLTEAEAELMKPVLRLNQALLN
ncbi:allophycocyanin [filamentous cyanobacterium LEGE 11480]|uniref:Allophycocyanin n=1 Tax=Romeriopsis navalis LEGE 11480 TaxID=2777977 RepID=A0A928VNZ8_9CYAN|nr:allophycocyanin [Romeriopsis navalis]MBE9029995.1 allophycocyanin [Romeriopsis navalis LEGE 11480]